MTETNIAYLRKAWAAFMYVHGLPFDSYVTHSFNCVNRGLRRCGIEEWKTQAEWLENAKGVI